MRPSRTRALILSLRPKTLTAALVPILVSTALVWAYGHPLLPWVSVLALISSIFIQVGTNLVNDALDFKKGADGERRLGEARATQQGWFTANQVLAFGGVSFFLALLAGLPLVWWGGWPILLIGILSLLCGYLYTGGPFPLAYVGLGDLFVILFFGLVAVGGVFFLHTKSWGLPVAVAGLQVGLLATVLIAINNLRDLDQDRLVNKKTMAVRLGPKLGRVEVIVLVGAAFALQFYWWGEDRTWAFLLPLLAAPFAVRVAWQVWKKDATQEFNRLLAQASFVHILFGMLISLGLALK
ncbi:MAG: 1,4-dihydroxy-2-naphthoate octaprenyltransferase [Bdellovibrionales bacterium]